MSKQGSKKETIFTLYLKENPEVIQKIIGIQIEKMRMEYNNGSQRVDLHGVNKESKIDIFVECQITTADEDHFLKTKDLINNTADGYVIWIASKFRKNSFIEEIKELLRNSPRKYINFFAVEVDPEVIERIKLLNRQYELDVLKNLDIIHQIKQPLKLVDYYFQMPPTHIGKAYIGEAQYDFDREDDVKDYMLDQLCELMPYYLNFHSSKKHSQNSKVMQIGAGLDEVMYHCSVHDVRNRAFVEIRFGPSKEDWFHAFVNKAESMRREIHPLIHFNDNKRSIGFYATANPNDIPRTVSILVEVFEKFINYFSQFTYGKKGIKDSA
ncbi:MULTISPECIES: hypothetical protein [Bacillaceae]|uniref:hypothetical protein n=1 Tax=Bacillaceae TaxID=186817 RepID=UPI00203DEDBD|nr:MULTISPECIES: hypothetical protein [Bacillaceae]MCM3570488.1 hypothetical protein [Neobacillus mesonae]MCP1156595.1 hypothetical protein [Bacillus infantis]